MTARAADSFQYMMNYSFVSKEGWKHNFLLDVNDAAPPTAIYVDKKNEESVVVKEYLNISVTGSRSVQSVHFSALETFKQV